MKTLKMKLNYRKAIDHHINKGRTLEQIAEWWDRMYFGEIEVDGTEVIFHYTSHDKHRVEYRRQF